MTESTAVLDHRLKKVALSGAVGALMVTGIVADVQGSTLLAPSLGAIVSDLNLDTGQVAWTLNASSVASAISVALTSRLGDIYGHRKVLAIITALSMLGCVLAAVATDFPMLVVGRFMMGLAVGIPLAWGMVRPRATSRQIQTVAVWLSTLGAIFAPIALVLGGLFLELNLPWQSSLWLVFAIYAVLLVFTLITPETPSSGRRGQTLDWVGAIGLGLWATAILLALNEGPSAGWTSPTFLGYALTGIVLFVLWLLQQRRAKQPVMSFEAMDVKQTVSGYIAVSTIGILGSILYIATPVTLQVPVSSGWGLGLDPLQSTLPLLAVIPGSFLANFLIRTLVPRFGTKAVLCGAYFASVACFLGLAIGHDVYALYFVWCFLYGTTVMTIYGIGFYLVASSTRQDNTAITFGVTNIILFLVGPFTVAIILNVTAPTADGMVLESSWISIFVGAIVAVVILGLVQLKLAPRHVTDLHAIDQPAPVGESVGHQTSLS